jgi:hypothetical protein
MNTTSNVYIYIYIYICFILFPLLCYNYSFIYLYKGYASYIHISRGYVNHKMLRTSVLEAQYFSLSSETIYTNGSETVSRGALVRRKRWLGEPGERSGYSDWLRAGRPRGRNSSTGRGKIFLISMASRPVLGPTQLIQWLLSPQVERPGREADHSPPTSAEVKNTWIYTFTSPYVFMA